MSSCLHRNWRADEWQVEEAEEVLVLVIEKIAEHGLHLPVMLHISIGEL